MRSIDVKGTLRTEFGKKAAKALRKSDSVPCVLYGVEKDKDGKPVAKAFTVTNEGLRKLVYTPHIYVVNLTIDDTTVNAIMKEIQFHPVTDKILHVDFYQIDESKPILMEVPVELEGLAEGVKAGGKINHVLRKLKVKASYNNIPEKLEVNISDLGLGKSIKVGDLNFENMEIQNSKSSVVCSVKMTRTAQLDTTTAATPAVGDAAAAAPAAGDAAAAPAK